MANVMVCVPIFKDEIPFVFKRVQKIIISDQHNIHKITTNPAQADIILFFTSLRPYFEGIRKHYLYKKYKEKCYVFSSKDVFLPLIPGLYTSARKSWENTNMQIGWSYIGVHDKEYIGFNGKYGEAEYLFSFMGSAKTHRIRKEILKLNTPDSIIINTDNKSPDNHNKKLSTNDYRKRYVDLMSKSKFVLCPRGFGTSSFRLYETMVVGRVPVLISDDLLLPKGPDWDSFSIRVDEKDISSIPKILKNYHDRYCEMGKRARSEWEKWYSDENHFHNMVEACLKLMENKNNFHNYKAYAQFLRPFHMARALKTKTKNLFKKKRAVLLL